MRARRGEALSWLESVLGDPDREGCRDWPYSTTPNGYPKIGTNRGGTRPVSHVVLERDGRPRPSPLHVARHTCDRPICIAPWHLLWGTRTENMQDAVQRGRIATGLRNGAGRLSPEQVAAIRADVRPQREIAVDYRISPSTVSEIKRGLIHCRPYDPDPDVAR